MFNVHCSTFNCHLSFHQILKFPRPPADTPKDRESTRRSPMRKFLILLLLLVTAQLQAGPNSYTVIVELQPNAKAQALAAAFGATIVDSIEGTSVYLLRVPTLAVLQSNPALGILSVQPNDVIQLRPRFSSLGILNTPASGAAAWYAGQPAMKLIRADEAAAYSSGRGVVVADFN